MIHTPGQVFVSGYFQTVYGFRAVKLVQSLWEYNGRRVPEIGTNVGI